MIVFFETDTIGNQIDTICNTIYLAFLCNECAEEYIDRNIRNKARKWHLYESSSYISSKADKTYLSKTDNQIYVKVPKMNITYSADRVIFQMMFISMLKEEWKTLIKKIK